MTIQAADRRARKTALVTLAGITVIGLVALYLLQRYEQILESWLVSNIYALSTHLILVSIVIVTFSIPTAGFALYLSRVSKQTIQHQRFPPPGMRVIRDTPVLEGSQAHLRGRLMMGLVMLLSLSAVLAPVLFWLILQNI